MNSQNIGKKTSQFRGGNYSGNAETSSVHLNSKKMRFRLFWDPWKKRPKILKKTQLKTLKNKTFKNTVNTLKILENLHL